MQMLVYNFRYMYVNEGGMLTLQNIDKNVI